MTAVNTCKIQGPNRGFLDPKVMGQYIHCVCSVRSATLSSIESRGGDISRAAHRIRGRASRCAVRPVYEVAIAGRRDIRRQSRRAIGSGLGTVGRVAGNAPRARLCSPSIFLSGWSRDSTISGSAVIPPRWWALAALCCRCVRCSVGDA